MFVNTNLNNCKAIRSHTDVNEQPGAAGRRITVAGLVPCNAFVVLCHSLSTHTFNWLVPPKLELCSDCSAVAIFNSNGINGSITFTPCCGDSFLVNAVLDGLLPAVSYTLFINERPYLQDCDLHRLGLPYGSALSSQARPTESIWSRYNGDCLANPQSCAPGDLTRGTPFLGSACASGSCFSAIVKQNHIPLSGPQSIVHLAVTIVPDNSTTPRACSWIRIVEGSPRRFVSYNVVEATFRDTPFIVGHFRAWQRADSKISATSYTYEYRYLNTLQTATFGHTYEIHANPVGSDFSSDSRRCRSAGDVFNPTQIENTDECSSTASAAECPIGALSTRHSSLVIAESWSSIHVVDFALPLSGNYSITQTSIVINELNDNGRLACASIQPLRSREVKANLRGKFNGSVIFSQQSVESPMKVILNITSGKGSPSEVLYLRIGELPIHDDMDDIRSDSGGDSS
eukprot:gene5951-9105_t